MIKVAGYCRVSTDGEDQANSFASQQIYFREYIGRNPDWELYDIYADEGITGTSTRKRIRFNQMIDDARQGKFQRILTKEISRFSRNILDTIRYTRELKNLGIGVIFMTENLNTLNPEAEMLLTFMGTIAQEESRRTSVRVKWGQTRRMEQGIVFGRSLLGYDVANGKITVNPEGSSVVQRIFHQYGIEKKGTAAIAAELEAAGYRTLSGSTKWHASHIIKILKNEKYVGDLVQKKSITPDYLSHARTANHGQEALVIIRNHHEPIIDRELWDTVQSELQRRSRHNGSKTSHANQYLFSGKLRCGECGAYFTPRTKRQKDGRTIRRWGCSGGCGVGKLLREDDGIRVLQMAIQSLQPCPEEIKTDIVHLVQRTVLEEKRVSGKAATTLLREQTKLEHRRMQALDAYLSGEITQMDLRLLIEGYEKRLSSLRVRIAAEQPSHEQPQQAAIRNALEAVLNGETDSEAFFRNILRQITVFKDGHITVSLHGFAEDFLFAEESMVDLFINSGYTVRKNEWR